LQAAFDQLRPDQRRALFLAGVEGVSYETAATICGTTVGTIKSRVHRARARLAEIMGNTEGELGFQRTGVPARKSRR
jgi:DNA-directed RNA polymerase specialized sigma24 family protein